MTRIFRLIMTRMVHRCLMKLVFWSLYSSWMLLVQAQSFNDSGSGDCNVTYTAPPGYFLPFGPENGDQQVPVNDDQSFGPYNLDKEFHFFGRNYGSLWINTNGGVSFHRAISQYVPQGFPLAGDYTMIHPYWADIDTSVNDGRIYYRQSRDTSLLEGTSLSHLRTAPDLALFVATWHNVTYYGGSECTQINTFQLVLVSVGSLSFTIFNYGDMQWIISATTHTAGAGYNAGDLVNYYDLPGSMTADLSPLTDYSNVHVPGQWMFRVDGQSGRVCELLPNTPGASAYPELEVCSPILSGPMVEDNIYVTFYCEVTITTSHPDTRAEVTFLFDGEPASGVPTYTINSSSNVALHEKYLFNNMGKTLKCKVSTYWKDEPADKSMEVFSNAYFVGVQATSNPLRVSEDDDILSGPSLYSTVPITCPPGGIIGWSPECQLTLSLLSSDNTLVSTRDFSTVTQPLRCQYTLRSADWNNTEQRATNRDSELVVKLKQEPLKYNPEDGSIFFRVLPFQSHQTRPKEKRDKDRQIYTDFWHSNSLGELKIYNVRSTPSAMCYSSGDPQMSTFDNHFYSAQQQGIFVLVSSNSSRVFEVHIRHWACVEGETGCSVACAVAVQEGNVTYALDMCNAEKIVHRLRLSDARLAYNPMSTDPSRRRYMIEMPSGAYIQVHIRTWGRGGMNVYVHVPPRDKGRTRGLCGTYDGDPDNDLTMANGSVVDIYDIHNSLNTFTTASLSQDSLNTFIESWRVAQDDSLFKRGTIRSPSNDESDVCSCALENINDVKCQNYHVHANIPIIFPSLSVSINSIIISNRGKRSTDAISHSISRRSVADPPDDEDVEDTYVFHNIEEDRSNPGNLSWPTWNGITEEQARSYCYSFLRNNTLSSCTDFVIHELHVIVEKCVKDIQITGSYSWANDKVTDVQVACIHNLVTRPVLSERDEGMLNAISQNIIDESCPEQCSGHGTCENSICACETDYAGPDCSVAAGAVSRPLSFLSTAICDVTSRPCKKVRLLVENLIISGRVTCRIDGQQMDGTRFIQEVTGEVSSYNEVECPLAPLYSLDLGVGPSPFYRYNVSLSNDGAVFSEPMAPSGSRSGAVVYDSKCIQCIDGSSCQQMDGTCLIVGKCFSNGEPDPDTPCKFCDVQVDSSEWSLLKVNHAPSLLMTWFSKAPGTTLNTPLSVYDVEGHGARVVAGDSPGVSVSESGHLLWMSEADRELTLQLVDECGAWRQETVKLVVGCSECSRPRERCVAGGSDPDCACPPGYTGELCQINTDDCQPSSCVHGTCHDLVNRQVCACSVGYTGSQCDREATICDPNPCLNLGTCASVGDTEYKCNCEAGYEGTNCEIHMGVWDNWSAFGECSKSCDYGVRTRTRTCLVDQCHGPVQDRELCSSFNCQENPTEDNQGVTLIFLDSEISQIVLAMDTISNLTATILNTHCAQAVMECCRAMKFRYSLAVEDTVTFFTPENILSAKGTPSGDSSGNVRVKLLVYKSHEALRDVCGAMREAESRRRRAAAPGGGEYLDQSLLKDVLTLNLHVYETTLGVRDVVFEEDPSEEGIGLTVIVGAAVGGFVLLVIIVVVAVVCVRESRTAKKDDKKDRSTQDRSAGDNPKA